MLVAADSTPAIADYDAAKRHFDSLPTEERISMTLGLIATGDFVGLMDFGFTKRYYKSVLAFEHRERLRADGILQPHEMERLQQTASQFFGTLGFEYVSHPVAGSRLLVPRGAFDTEYTTQQGLAYERRDKNLSLSFVAYSDREKTFSGLYESLATETAQRKISYKRLRDGYFVASGTFRGRNFYTWVSATGGGSTGFTVSWTSAWDGIGSKLAVLLANSFIAVPATNAPESPRSQQPSNPPPSRSDEAPRPVSSTGTGFKVTAEGHVLTNFHVAGQCLSLSLRRTGELPVAAELVADDETNDLALLKARIALTGAVAAFRGGPAPRVGTEIAVFGFPLSDVLASSGNIVTGNITSLAGIGNDSRQFQISAPVQPGNSGGPVLDREGRIVAVVVSKLDAMKMVAKSGDIPQNVNFAIKGNVAMNFMDGAGVTYLRQETGQPLTTPDIADLAQDFTFLVECRK